MLGLFLFDFNLSTYSIKVMKFFSFIESDGYFEFGDKRYSESILFTPWSYNHFIVGYVSELVGMSYLQGFILHSIYEAISLTSEYTQKKWRKSYVGLRRDSYINTVGDTFVFMAGMYLSKKIKNKWILYFILISGIVFHSKWVQQTLVEHRYMYLKQKVDLPDIKEVEKDTVNEYIYLVSWLFICLYVLKFGLVKFR